MAMGLGALNTFRDSVTGFILYFFLKSIGFLAGRVTYLKGGYMALKCLKCIVDF